MPESPHTFYLTTPIYYVNARPHIGHAYTTIVADVLARRHRLQGDDTFFLTGTDEHGQKIERSAAAAGIPPQQFATQVSQSFRDLWDRMGITYDDFIRTTEPRHHQAVQKLFQTLQANGHIYLDSYTGAYCVSDETFVDVPSGTPCPDCGRPTETVTEENYFFRLSAFQQPLIDLIETNQLTIEPDARRNEVLSFLRGGPQLVPGALRDLSISRSSFTWGIPVPKPVPASEVIPSEARNLSIQPGSPQIPTQDHVIYVWLDALTNYMTAVGYGDDSPEAQAKFARYWPADLHIVGKEIIRFHCVYWPAFLLAAQLPLPKKVVAHGWLLFEDSKMSKSKGNIVRTETILDAFGPLCPPQPSISPTEIIPPTPEVIPSPSEVIPPTPEVIPSPSEVIPSEARNLSISPDSPQPPTKAQQDLFAADILRYFLLREIPFGQDGSFSFEALITRYNADLANGYGNLVSRTLRQIHDRCGENVPQPAKSYLVDTGIHPHTRVPLAPLAHACLGVLKYFFGSAILKNSTQGVAGTINSSFDAGNYSESLTWVSKLVGKVDEFLNDQKPWKLADGEDLNTVLYTAAESIRIITALLHPILPHATANVWRQLGLGDIELAAQNGDLKTLTWGGLQPGTKLGPLSPIFPRADKGLAQLMTDIEAKEALNKRPAPPIPSADRSEASLPEHYAPTDPAAGPRTTTLPEPNPGTAVAGSTALTTGPTPPPTDNGQRTTDNAPTITIDDFAKVELRVAKILVAERIPKADKLLRLEVDLGDEKRQILSGIAEWYTPEDLIGRRIVVITNLAPRKMRGLESHGMLLAASTEGGKPSLATFPESDDLPLGSRLK